MNLIILLSRWIFLDIVYSINKFQHYIAGYPTFVHTDHSAIKYLMNKPVTNARVNIWLLLLQELDITNIDKPRRENVVADFLSCFTNSDDNFPFEDSFPDEHLFAVSPTPLGMQMSLITWMQESF